MREREMQYKSKGETVKLARGDSNNDHCNSMHESENESIDELGLVAGVFERESDTLRVTGPKRKQVTFNDTKTTIENSEQMSSIDQLNAQSVLRPIKQQRSVSKDMANLDTELCYVTSKQIVQFLELIRMDRDNPRRYFHQREKTLYDRWGSVPSIYGKHNIRRHSFLVSFDQ